MADPTTWATRAADRSPAVRSRRSKAVAQSEAIVAAARRLVIVRTDGFTIQELVREAHVGLPTFYRHFESKDELLVAVVGELIADAATFYEEAGRDETDPVARLRTYLTAMLATLADEHVARFATGEYLRLRQLFPDRMDEAARPVVDLVLATITEATAVGAMAPEDPERDAELITEMAITSYHRYAVQRRGTPEEAAAHLVDFVLHGLRADPTPTRPRPPSAAKRSGPAKRSGTAKRSSRPPKKERPT